MSLKAGGACKLGVDSQHAGWREARAGADPGIGIGQHGAGVRTAATGGSLRLGGAGIKGARVSAAGPGGAGPSAAVCGQDDGVEPGADDEVDGTLSGAGHGAGNMLSAAPVRAAVHARRRGTAGDGG
ncbi:MAG: hypothetical protein M3Y72_04640 [Acidobacteriota bacterium]|nr:hypothetical protein [Acidobacteriota bacterium]